LGSEGYAYCPFKEGDEQYVKTLDLQQSFWNSKPKCHISNPSGCPEAKNTKGYYTIIGARYELNFGYDLMNNAECIKKAGPHQRYW